MKYYYIVWKVDEKLDGEIVIASKNKPFISVIKKQISELIEDKLPKNKISLSDIQIINLIEISTEDSNELLKMYNSVDNYKE